MISYFLRNAMWTLEKQDLLKSSESALFVCLFFCCCFLVFWETHEDIHCREVSAWRYPERFWRQQKSLPYSESGFELSSCMEAHVLKLAEEM